MNRRFATNRAVASSWPLRLFALLLTLGAVKTVNGISAEIPRRPAWPALQVHPLAFRPGQRPLQRRDNRGRPADRLQDDPRRYGQRRQLLPVQRVLHRNVGLAPEAVNALCERRIAHAPMRRMGEPEQIAKAVLFRTGPDASCITGIDLFVDGGVIELAG